MDTPENEKNYIIDLNKAIVKLYDEKNEEDKDSIDINELKTIINLIKIDDNYDFYKAFENQIYKLINSNENNSYFDFKYTSENILNYILFYLKKENIRLYNNVKKKNKSKKSSNTKIKIVNVIKQNKNNQNTNNNIDNSYEINNTNNKNYIKKERQSRESSSRISSSNFFSIGEVSHLSQKALSNNNLKEEKKSDPKTEPKEKKGENEKGNVELLQPKEELFETKMKQKNDVELNEKKTKEVEKIKIIQYKDLFDKKDNINFEESSGKKIIRFYEDTSEVNGNSFEYDTINYIFKHLSSITSDKNFFITYNIYPDMDKINNIFQEFNLPVINKIQFDFLIINLKISGLVKLLIEIYPGIHPNSKIFLNSKDKDFLSLDELNKLKKDKENDEERIDLIGEIGINIFNWKEKSYQLIKYAKIIHNINFLIKKKAKQLPYLLDLLHFTNNKKLLLLFTDGSYSNFMNIKNNNFLTIQKNLNIDSLLVYRNKNSLFRTKFLKKLFKKYKKNEINDLKENLIDEFHELIKRLLKSNEYEKVVRQLNKIEKKLGEIKTDLFNKALKNVDFINICNNIM